MEGSDHSKEAASSVPDIQVPRLEVAAVCDSVQDCGKIVCKSGALPLW
jgi:hypothetical protein